MDRDGGLLPDSGEAMWSLYAAVAMLCFVGMQLLFKQLSRLGLSSPVILVFVFGFACLLYLGHIAAVRPALPVGGRVLGLLAVAAVLSYLGNLYMVRALAAAPNPGYAIAIVGLQALLVTLASVALYGSHLTWLKALGVVLSVAGVVLLVL